LNQSIDQVPSPPQGEVSLSLQGPWRGRRWRRLRRRAHRRHRVRMV